MTQRFSQEEQISNEFCPSGEIEISNLQKRELQMLEELLQTRKSIVMNEIKRESQLIVNQLDEIQESMNVNDLSNVRKSEGKIAKVDHKVTPRRRKLKSDSSWMKKGENESIPKLEIPVPEPSPRVKLQRNNGNDVREVNISLEDLNKELDKQRSREFNPHKEVLDFVSGRQFLQRIKDASSSQIHAAQQSIDDQKKLYKQLCEQNYKVKKDTVKTLKSVHSLSMLKEKRDQLLRQLAHEKRRYYGNH